MTRLVIAAIMIISSFGKIIAMRITQNTLLLFICLFQSLYAAQVPGITIPLQYHPLYGVYTETIKIGKNPVQEVEAIVDTGSSTLLLVADKNYCPSCSKAITQGVITPANIKGYGTAKIVSLNYGSANDTAMEYMAPLQYSDNETDKLSMKVFILKKSDQPSSIIGMINRDLRENKVKFTPFLVHLTKNFIKYSELTFVLCASHGKSYYHLGPLNLPKTQFKSKLVGREFYTINTTGFYEKNEQPITQVNESLTGAIMDTGTGGYIILTPKLYKPLHAYIYKNAGVKNQNLGNLFWQQNYCIMENEVDFASFPPIKIGFQKLNSKEGYYLTLKPTDYINQGGCGIG